MDEQTTYRWTSAQSAVSANPSERQRRRTRYYGRFNRLRYSLLGRQDCTMQWRGMQSLLGRKGVSVAWVRRGMEPEYRQEFYFRDDRNCCRCFRRIFFFSRNATRCIFFSFSTRFKPKFSNRCGDKAIRSHRSRITRGTKLGGLHGSYLGHSIYGRRDPEEKTPAKAGSDKSGGNVGHDRPHTDQRRGGFSAKERRLAADNIFFVGNFPY